MKKRLIIGLTLFLILTTYRSQNLFLDFKFNIEKIIVENSSIYNEMDIKKGLISIYNKNLLFLDKESIKKILAKKSFIQSYEVKKIYPNKLKIKIYEKKPIAILQSKKKKFYFTDNNDFVVFQDLENYKDLPIVFGKRKNFKILFKALNEINFSIDQIKKFYFFESNRWDLLTYQNKLIKLPNKDYLLSLKNYLILKNDKNFDKYKIFDYRIKDQLILK